TDLVPRPTRRSSDLHQAEVDDVGRDLRVETGAQLLPDQLLHRRLVGAVGQFDRRRDLLADRVRVLPGDPEQVGFHEHRVAAAQRLGDVAGAAGGQGHRITLRHQDGRAVALEADGFAGSRIHGAYCIAPPPGLYPVAPPGTRAQ